ncbi:hypothetical protein [Dyella sp.]|jgi:hypothetical protein|uniref:hypothetical protein n=1 Tax=Dyella sp. TaxID=1869338 RepID=UPI002D7821FB|nr:hypothetical protein [Dyella sp.]HET6433431.1 hypothetical protein [Dyella sp.]
MSSEPLRLFALTRPTTWLAMGTVRLMPLGLLLVRAATADTPVSAPVWMAALIASLAATALFWQVETRCSSDDQPYGRGLLVIAASVSCGWMAMDVLFVLCTVMAAQCVSCALALTPNPPARFQQLVAWFYRHRMYQ